MVHAGPLLAAPGDLIQFLVIMAIIVVSVVGPLISKIVEAQREAAKRAAQQGRGPRAGGPQAAGPQAPRRPPRDQVEEEIGEFLRRAAERRAGGPPQRPPQPARRPPEPARAPQEPPRRLVEAARPISQRTDAPAAPPLPSAQPAAQVQVEVVAEPRLGEGVRKHVQQYLSTDDMVRHAQHLGDDVGQTDERLQARLHQTFDHELSRIGRLPGELAVETEEAPTVEGTYAEGDLPVTAAAGFAALLANADTLRQAIVINEILQRPEHRWA